MLVVGQEVGAGSAAFAGGDHVLIGTVGVHDEDLIALKVATGGLEDETFAIGRPVCFGILAAVGELVDIGQFSSTSQCCCDKNQNEIVSHKGPEYRK